MWREITEREDLRSLMEEYDGFRDGRLTEMQYGSGAFLFAVRQPACVLCLVSRKISL